MKPIFYGIVVIGALLIYEAVKGLGTAKASSTTNTGTGTNALSAVPSGGGIPSNWLTALAKSESPSALQGNFNYGAFGLQCGAGQGVANSCTPPILGGAGDVASYDLFSNWGQAVNGLTAWIQKNAPGAFQYAQSGNCLGFFQALQQGGYGGTQQWPSNVCGLA